MQGVILRCARLSFGLSVGAVAGGCANSAVFPERVVERVLVVVVEQRPVTKERTVVKTVPVSVPKIVSSPEKDHEGVILRRGTLNEKPQTLEARP